MRKNIEYLFYPKTIAVVGASAKPGKVSNSFVKNLIEYGYKGKIFPVNISGESVFGLNTYRNITEIEDEVDMAAIIIPAKSVMEAVEECGKKGVKSLLVITSGFGEVGEAALEKQIVEIARKYQMPLLGPNIFGVIYTPESMNATFGPRDVLRGKISFATQSGALGAALISKTINEHIGLSCVASLGNKADVDDDDILEFFEQDKNTNVIVLYMEGIKEGRRFLQVAESIVPRLPIIVIKSGKSEEGARAAASHTGSLAGSDRIFEAAFRQVGILRAEGATEAFDWANILQGRPETLGKHTVIITNGGGAGVMAADACSKYCVHLLNDHEFLEGTFRKYIPSFGSTRNPIDITGQGGEETIRNVLHEALAQDDINAILLIYCEAATSNFDTFSRYVIDEMEKFTSIKPVIVCLIGGEKPKRAIDSLNQKGIPAYTDIERAASALGALYRWSANSKKIREERTESFTFPKEEIHAIIEGVKREKRLQLLESEAKDILKLAGFRVPEFGLGRNLDECASIASSIGYPIVLKISSEHITHKSDIGGVKVGIEDRGGLEQAYREIMRNVSSSYPDVTPRGMLVTRMVDKGIETILGVTHDPAFGPVLMFGLGGIYVEIMKDVVFRVAPLSDLDALDMITEIKASSVLYGARGGIKGDIPSLQESILRLGDFACDFPEIAELDINPLFIFEKGKGCTVVDARMTLAH